MSLRKVKLLRGERQPEGARLGQRATLARAMAECFAPRKPKNRPKERASTLPTWKEGKGYPHHRLNKK